MDGSLQPVDREYVALNETSRSADKGTFPHWMIKEINETPTVATTAYGMPAEKFTGTFDPRSGRPITLIGIGSAFYVAQLGQYLFSALALRRRSGSRRIKGFRHSRCRRVRAALTLPGSVIGTATVTI